MDSLQDTLPALLKILKEYERLKIDRGFKIPEIQRDGMGREAGGAIGMVNICKSMADSCKCMAKTTTIL